MTGSTTKRLHQSLATANTTTSTKNLSIWRCSFAHLRKRQTAPGGNAGGRKRGRQHHSKYSNDPFGARATARRCAETFGGARRGLHGQTWLRKIKRRKAQGRSAAVCKSAQRSGRFTQATGSGDRGEAPPRCCVVWNWGDRGSGRGCSLGNFPAPKKAGPASHRALVGG